MQKGVLGVHEQEVNPDTISNEGIRRLLAFLPFFDHDGTNYGTGPVIAAAKSRKKAITIFPGTFSAKVSEFIKACYEENFVQPFDWGKWRERHEDDLASDAFVAKADITTIIRMLTVHIRADRFCDGHLLSVMKDGTIYRILRRLKEVHSQRESEGKRP